MTATLELVAPPKSKHPRPRLQGAPPHLVGPFVLPRYGAFAIGNHDAAGAHLQLPAREFHASIELRREGWLLGTDDTWGAVGPLAPDAHGADGTWILESGDNVALGGWTYRFVDDEQPERFGRAWRASGWQMIEPVRAGAAPVWRAEQRGILGDASCYETRDQVDTEASLVARVRHPAVPAVLDRMPNVLVRADAAGASFWDVIQASERQGARLDASIALHAIACVAEACAAGADVACVAVPATMVLAWDGRVLFTGFGRMPVARGPLSEEHWYLRHDAPVNWRRRTGATAGPALGRVLDDLARGQRGARGKRSLDPAVVAIVRAAEEGRLAPAQLAAQARALAGVIEERAVSAVVKALFPDAWRREEQLRDERLSF